MIVRETTGALATLGLADPLVSTGAVQEIPRLATGKVRRFVPLPRG